MGSQWQWIGNPQNNWTFTNVSKGSLRLYFDRIDSVANLWGAPNVLLQKFSAELFMVTTKMTFVPNRTRLENEKAGLTIMGFSYASISLKSKKDGINLVYTLGRDADNGRAEAESIIMKATDSTVYLRVKVTTGGKCRFNYSWDGANFTDAGDEFTAKVGRCKGAKVGIFCTRQSQINDSGFADFDWFRTEPIQ